MYIKVYMIIGTSMLYPSPPDIATLCHVQVLKFSEVPLRSSQCTGFSCIATSMIIVVHECCFSFCMLITVDRPQGWPEVFRQRSRVRIDARSTPMSICTVHLHLETLYIYIIIYLYYLIYISCTFPGHHSHIIVTYSAESAWLWFQSWASDKFEPFLLIFDPQISLVGGFNPKNRELWFSWASSSWNTINQFWAINNHFLCRTPLS